MKIFQLLGVCLFIGLTLACSNKNSDGIAPNPDLDKVVGQYQLTSEESVRRNENRVWKLIEVDESHVKVEETLTEDLNSKSPKITNRIIDSVLVRTYNSGWMLDFQNSNFHDPDFTINGHKNFKIFGHGTIQPDMLYVTLWMQDLTTQEVIPYSGLLEFKKFK